MTRTLHQDTRRSYSHRGFTLIELLLVVGVIGILAGIVIVSVNPTKQLADARNTQRRADLQIIANALYQYSIDHEGKLPVTITTIETELCRTGVNIDCTGLIDINFLTGAYIPSIPFDPSEATETSTQYTIQKMLGRMLLRAPYAEFGATISVTK